MSRRRPPLVALASALIAPVIAMLIAAGAVLAMRGAGGGEPSPSSFSLIGLDVLARTLLIALTIGVLATLLAIPGAWLMRSLHPRWVLVGLAPMLLPMYLTHAAWSLGRAPGTIVGDLLEGGSPELWRWANLTQAIVSLALWSWPIAMLILGARAVRIEQEMLDALAIERAGRLARCRMILGLLKPALVGSVGIVGLLMLGSAVPLHVAQVETYAIVVWRRLAESPSPAGAWMSAIPLLVIAVVGGWLLAGRLLARSAGATDAHTQQHAQPSRGIIGLAVLIWTLSIVVPLVLLMLAAPPGPAWSKFIAMEGESIGLSALLALFVGACGLMIAATTAQGFSASPSSVSYRVQSLALRLWIIMALMPGVLIGSALVSVASWQSLTWVAETNGGIVIAMLARFGAIAALAGWWLARSEPRAFQDLRALHGGTPFRTWWRTAAPLQSGGLFGAALATGLLALHEIEATVVIAPAGAPTLSLRLLSLLHYLRDDQLAVGVVLLTGSGLVVAIVVALFGGRQVELLRRLRTVAPLLVLSVLLVGCGDRGGDQVVRAPRRVIGALGTAPGEFFYPRAIESAAERLWIIDKTGRVQGLTIEGEPTHSWVMPSSDRGKPTGLTAGPDGFLYVADTHEQRVSVFEPLVDGTARFVRSWGEYGEGPGQFIYPTDVAIVADESGGILRFYVSEYGGNDRISAFDAQGAFLFDFGALGYDPDPSVVRFNRPQAIMHMPRTNELLVADAANHRLGRFSLEGEPLEWIGASGGMPGRGSEEFSYPYGLALLPDGTVLVAEYGSSRVQHLDLSRQPGSRTISILGAPGRGEGEFVSPWGISVGAGEMFVLDSGNNRIQVFAIPRSSLASRGAAR